MCLIVLGWQVHPEFDLLLAANRDEFHDRAAESAHWWNEPANLFAGRDAKAGGAWCGADRRGRFAAVTNVRERHAPEGPRSRGELVRDYFVQDRSAASWAAEVAGAGSDYSPFNLLVGDAETLYFVSNRDDGTPRALARGVVAISNGHWGEHWSKTDRAEAALCDAIRSDALAPDRLLDLLHDTEPAPESALPDTGFGLERERFLSSPFITSALYGTRASTVIKRSRAHATIEFVEQSFDRAGDAVHRVHQAWPIENGST